MTEAPDTRQLHRTLDVCALARAVMPRALTPEFAVRRAECAVVLRHCCMASLTNTIPQTSMLGCAAAQQC
jgi:hypothetical protein